MPLTKVDTQLLSNGYTTDSTGLNTISAGNLKVLATAAGTANDRKVIFQNELGTQAVMAMGTTGSAGGVNKFYIQTNAGYSLNLDANGYMTVPYQPAFSASRQAGAVDNNTTVVWDTTALNRTSSYNASNGRFTAPIAGVYAFWWRGDNAGINGTTSSTAGLQMSIRINGTDNSNSWGWTGNNTGGHASGFLIIQLSVNDYVEVRNQNYGQMQGTPGYNNGFGGYLIG